VILINVNKLRRLKFNPNKIDEYLYSIDGLKEFMKYHQWSRIPIWAFSPKGREIIIKTVKMHNDLFKKKVF
jgi:hypothetical protein